MVDPFAVLRSEPTPVSPGTAFADRLRARIERALDLPPGVSPMTDPRPAAIPYLAVRGAAEAITWYRDVLGAQPHGDPIVMEDGRIGHCEMGLAGGVFYLADEHPEIGVVAPTAGAHAVSLMVVVDDTDATRARMVAAGGTSDRDTYEAHGHRNAWVADPFGHRWGLQGPVLGNRIRQGDVGYLMWRTPDAAKAQAFYTAVLGWDCQPGSGDQGRQVTNTSIPMGIYGGADYSGVWCCYAVDDVDEATEVVRTSGGSVLDVRDAAYGRIADCLDDQGIELSVYVPAEDAERPAINGVHQGDVSYLTMEFADTKRGIAFYRAVLGIGADQMRPMAGMPSGRENVVVPMWRVDDIDEAVQRVVAAGGAVEAVESMPYGLTCVCTDDQGGRFYLGQH